MQIKPFFKEYKEKRIPYKKDDRGVMYSLVKYKGILPEKKDANGIVWEKEKKIKGVKILSDVLTRYTNGATGYDEDMFWESEPTYGGMFDTNCHTPDERGGYKIYQVYQGSTGLIEGGFSTIPHLVKISLFEKVKRY